MKEIGKMKRRMELAKKFKNNGETYEGEFRNDKREGEGTLNYWNGSSYVGHFKEGECDGFGTYKTLLGNFYKGFFKKGLFHGKGIFTSYNLRYKGKDNYFLEEK